MCDSIEQYANKKAIQTAIEIWLDYKDTKENILAKVCKKFSISKKKAEEYYEACTKAIS